MGVLFAGDSITDSRYETAGGWLPSGYFPGMTCAVTGWQRVGQDAADPLRAAISGTTLAANAGWTPELRALAMNSTFADRVTRFHPDGVVAMLGTNDFYMMGKSEDLNTWRDAVDAFCVSVKALPGAPFLVVCGLIGTLGFIGAAAPTWSYGNDWLRGQLDAITRTVTLSHDGKFVSLAAVGAGDVRPDGHPNPRGHAIITGELLIAAGAL